MNALILLCLLLLMLPVKADYLPGAEITFRESLDYNLSREDLFQKLKTNIKNFSGAEFESWLQEKRFETKNVRSQTFYFSRSLDNLFFRYPEIENRRKNKVESSEVERNFLKHIREIKKESLKSHSPFALQKKFVVEYTVSPKKNLALQYLKAWLPLPIEYKTQRDFSLLSFSNGYKESHLKNNQLANAYFEGKGPFKLKYSFETSGIYSFANKTKNPASKPAHGNYLSEKSPHVIFTAEIKNLSNGILQNHKLTDKEKAKAFYDWISENIKYSFAPEYSTISNISQITLQNKYGDCGQASMLFITLCRLNGIPARWQSGWLIFPGKQTIHDWAEVYLADYGWIPVDPYMGMHAMQYFKSLSFSEQKELRDFYFGGLDAYRLIVNLNHNQELNPKKCALRSDPIDFQRAELETIDCKNIYFNMFNYKLTWKEL